MSTITIKTLADKLKLSKATISKALRDSHEISIATKKRVVALAAKYNYSPNPYASSLRRKKSKTIAVVIPEIADNFFSLAINGIQSVAEKKGYHVLIYLTHEKFINEKNIMDEFQHGRVDGVLISITGETKTTKHITNLQAGNIPVVFFDRAAEGVHAATITTNDFECGYIATKHLLEKGCSKPVFLSVSKSLPICIKRADGFIAALKDAGIPQKDRRIVYCTGTEKANYSLIKKNLLQPDKPDGIVASVEKMATQVYMAAQEKNISIPHDLKVIAFSNLEIVDILNPSLSTITQPAFELGKTAATLLFKGIEKSHYNLKNEKIIIPSILVKRNSTGDL